MIRNLTCIEITCDDCGDDCFEEGTPHFDSLAKAKDGGSSWFDEWLFTDAEQVCPDCHAKRVCAATFHDWGDWRRHPPDGITSYRSCDRCRALDYTVAAQAGGAT